MKLSKLPMVSGRVRDGEFTDLGFLKYLCYVEDARLVDRLLANGTTQGSAPAQCVITTPEIAPRVPDRLGLLVSRDPRRTFHDIHKWLMLNTEFYRRGALDAPRVGNDTVIEPGAMVYPWVRLGERCVVRDGAIVGTEGFEPRGHASGHGKARNEPTELIPHAGEVWIGDDVEIQSGSLIDRALFGEATRIGDRVKIDKQVHIGHNSQVGPDTLVASGALLAGSAIIGARCWIGPRVVISSGVHVGDGAVILIGSLVLKDVPPGARVHPRDPT
ncbi:MAG: DapH/DapD/GlmU-related protein [Candidatus Limnocylindria bacterium]|nr:DapH/DapD/GlmU-related protein [Candidatus Limnocylindria bacterium]